MELEAEDEVKLGVADADAVCEAEVALLIWVELILELAVHDGLSQQAEEPGLLWAPGRQAVHTEGVSAAKLTSLYAPDGQVSQSAAPGAAE